tara:strand:+ start:279 stop:470 length:192 start_codon:yes stop_codon:yes gene_type:complete
MEPGVIKKQMQKVSKKLHSSMSGMAQMEQIWSSLEDIRASVEDAHKELRGEKGEKEKKGAKSR